MDLKLVRRLIRMMDRGNLLEIEVEEGGKKVRLRRGEVRPPLPSPFPAPAPAGMAPALESPAPTSAAEGVVQFRSPMVGTFYRTSSPEAEPFVSKGTKVKPDNVLCIVEAMKVMNEVRAEVEGEVVDVLVKNGEPVEFGQPLFLIRTR